jgi:hypothetical protein
MITPKDVDIVVRSLSNTIADAIYNNAETGHKSVIPDGTTMDEVVTILVGAVVMALWGQYKHGEMDQLARALTRATLSAIQSIEIIMEKSTHDRR